MKTTATWRPVHTVGLSIQAGLCGIILGMPFLPGPALAVVAALGAGLALLLLARTEGPRRSLVGAIVFYQLVIFVAVSGVLFFLTGDNAVSSIGAAAVVGLPFLLRAIAPRTSREPFRFARPGREVWIAVWLLVARAVIVAALIVPFLRLDPWVAWAIVGLAITAELVDRIRTRHLGRRILRDAATAGAIVVILGAVLFLVPEAYATLLCWAIGAATWGVVIWRLRRLPPVAAEAA